MDADEKKDDEIEKKLQQQNAVSRGEFDTPWYKDIFLYAIIVVALGGCWLYFG